MRNIFLFVLLTIVFPLAGMAQQVCISEEEEELLELVNDFRKKNDKEKIEPSVVMCYVADVHTKDLYLNYKNSLNCNLYYWSDKGRWSKCCNDNSFSCMYDKPFELTGYRSKGYELISYYSDGISIESVVKNWKENRAASNFLLQEGKYSNKNWMVIGVSIFEGYISVWMGELSDKKGSPKVCKGNSGKTKNIIADEVPIYILIVGNHPTKKLAQKEVEKLKNRGYENAFFIKHNSRYRIIADRYYGYAASKKAKNNLPKRYNKSWITKE
ncbi:MAG: SPOR domain-containing protein [Bacteroidota bacterium]|nr:SPOR domain-containing protein [Bacteroidota bacterium]